MGAWALLAVADVPVSEAVDGKSTVPVALDVHRLALKNCCAVTRVTEEAIGKAAPPEASPQILVDAFHEDSQHSLLVGAFQARAVFDAPVE